MANKSGATAVQIDDNTTVAVERFARYMQVTDDVVNDEPLMEAVCNRATHDLMADITAAGYKPYGDVSMQVNRELFGMSYEVPRRWWEKLLRRRPQHRMLPPMSVLLTESRAIPTGVPDGE